MIRKPIVKTLFGIGLFLLVATALASESLPLPRGQAAGARDASRQDSTEDEQLNTLLQAGRAAGQDEEELTAVRQWWAKATPEKRAEYFRRNAPRQDTTEDEQLDALLQAGKAAGQAEEELTAVRQWWAKATPKQRADYYVKESASQEQGWEDYLNQGAELAKAGKHREAIALAKKAIELGSGEPGIWKAHDDLGRYWVLLEEYDLAIAACNTAIKLNPDEADVYVTRGFARSANHEYDKAIADYDRAIELNPDSAPAYSARGMTWGAQQEYDKAIADYDRAIELDPDCGMAYSGRGAAWNAKQEHEKAVADFDRAIELHPHCAMAYSGRGAAWNARQQYDKALADYEQAIAIDANDAESHNAIAWLQATCPDSRCRDGKKAVENANKALLLNVTPNVMDTLAAAYAESGDFDNAREWQSKAIAFSEDEKEKEELRVHLDSYEQNKPWRAKPDE